ncbi:MAG: hypothetical protein SFU57_05760 [Gemmatimonadales bacterium]|nr:hypothetical protein [Gemmatimonadales bacterium]
MTVEAGGGQPAGCMLRRDGAIEVSLVAADARCGLADVLWLAGGGRQMAGQARDGSVRAAKRQPGVFMQPSELGLIDKAARRVAPRTVDPHLTAVDILMAVSAPGWRLGELQRLVAGGTRSSRMRTV